MGDGAITFSDLVGRLTVLRVDCDKCGRHGRYLVDKLVYDQGADTNSPSGSASSSKIVRRRTRYGLAMQ
jgi:hypothetical protein